METRFNHSPPPAGAIDRRASGQRSRSGRRLRVNIGFPPAIFEVVRDMAIDERRSFTAQVITMLESYVPPKALRQ